MGKSLGSVIYFRAKNIASTPLATPQKNKTPIQVIGGENDINSFTVALNIYNKDNLKDVPLEDAIKIIQTELKEPEFTINGWWHWNKSGWCR